MMQTQRGAGVTRQGRASCLVACALMACSEANVRAPSAMDSGSPSPRIAELDAGVRGFIDSGLSDAATDGKTTDAKTTEAETFKIATWNLGVFGPSKAARAEDVATIAKIIRGYDLIALQEIKDVQGLAPVVLKAAVDELGHESGGAEFGLLLSERGGQQADDTAGYQEQYAYFYRIDRFEELTPEPQLFPDAENDYFQREPFVARLRVRGTDDADFALVNFHAAPNTAVFEMAALHHVAAWATETFDEPDVLLLGDFNAGCDFAEPAQLAELPLRGPGFTWLIPDDADTNVFAETACAYDRLVLTTDSLRWMNVSDWGVDNPFTDRAISDHWPVWVTFEVR